MTVVANDFVPVQPYNATYVTLGVGQRLHVVVEATGASNGAYWMRSNISEICNLPLQPHGLAAIYYDNADTSKLPTSAANFYAGDDGTCTTVSIFFVFIEWFLINDTGSSQRYYSVLCD